MAGTFCSGKSTLIDDIVVRDARFQAAPEGPRRILAHCSNKILATEPVRSYLLVNQLLVEHEMSGVNVNVLFEGGLVNNLAHDRLLLSPVPDRSSIIEAIGHERYDVAILCDYSEIPLQQDGQRFTNAELRRQLDQAVRDTLRALDYSPIEITGTREARLDSVLSLF